MPSLHSRSGWQWRCRKLQQLVLQLLLQLRLVWVLLASVTVEGLASNQLQ
jgi:hypothetical protein